MQSIVGQQQQQHQLMQARRPSDNSAANICVVLYDYTVQQADEIELEPGQLVQVLDSADFEWSQVQTLTRGRGGSAPRTGYFPSMYLAKLYQGERPLQVAQTIQVKAADSSSVKLLRGQVSGAKRATLSRA